MLAEEGPPRLAGPYEIMEMKDNEVMNLQVLRWELGTVVIHPRWAGAPSEKEVLGLRLHVDKKQKPTGLQYWDVTAQTLIAQLRPLLQAGMEKVHITRIKAVGEGPKKRFTVEMI